MAGSLLKSGTPIRDLEDWRARAGPKRDVQWKDGRSAKESAKAWLAVDGIPTDLIEVVGNHPDFGDVGNWLAEPEALVRFDDFRGEPPNIDVLICAEDSVGPFVIVVEAKADEPFGNTISETYAAAKRRLDQSPNSMGLARLERLSEAIFGTSSDDPKLAPLRYQLFTATGAALAEAERRGADRAVVLVHEFVSDLTTSEKRHANQADLAAYISMLAPEMTFDGLVGPIVVPGAPLVAKTAKLYIGKAVSNVSSGGV